MFLWSTIIATLVGLVSAAVIPRESGFKTLSQGQIDSTDVYAHYAAAAMCSPDSLTYWSCGSTSLTCGPIFFLRKGRMGCNVRLTSSDASFSLSSTLHLYFQFRSIRNRRQWNHI